MGMLSLLRRGNYAPGCFFWDLDVAVSVVGEEVV